MRDAVTCVRHILRWEQRGRPARGPGPVFRSAPDPERAARAVDAIHRQRVAATVAPHALALGFPPTTVDQFAQRDRHRRIMGLVQIADTVMVSSALRAAGVDHLILKGAALAAQTTGDELARAPGDVDVLVAPAAVQAATDALTRAGLTRDPGFCPAPGSPLFPATAGALQECLLRRDGREVDLHWRLDIAARCLRWPFPMLLQQAEYVTLGSHKVPTLGRSHAAIFNASHATKDAWPHLRAIVDQVRIQRGLDLAAAAAEARRVGGYRRWKLSQGLVGLLLGNPDARPDALSRQVWDWLIGETSPQLRRGPRPTVALLAMNVLTQDDLHAATQRLATLVWPVREMAEESLGDNGSAHPWLYPLATPYFLPRRFREKAGRPR